MGQKNFAHGHAAFIVGVILLALGVIIYLIESRNPLGNTWIAWVLIVLGAIELIIGGMVFGAHATSEKEPVEKEPAEKEKSESIEIKLPKKTENL